MASPQCAGDELWAISAYFNPLRFVRKRVNYRLFRARLPIPLLTIELACDGRFDLSADDANQLIQLAGGDVLWQKERLLNVALAALPASCRQVVWIDCDTLVGVDDWPAALRDALGRYPLVQAFRTHYDLAKDVTTCDPAQADFMRSSVAHAVHTGRAPADCLRRTLGKLKEGCTTGIAWGARRDFIERHGLYDHCIAGGGDRALACAAFGCFDELIDAFHLNDSQQAHYLAWARPFFASVVGDVGFVNTDVFHLWHGSLFDRGYVQRHQALGQFQFDPFVDVRVDERGMLCWNSAKPALHQCLRDYFAARREDG